MNWRAAWVGLCLLCVGAGEARPKIAITEIMYDPRSQETDDLQTEWVEVHNFGDETVHLKGFRVTSGSKAKPQNSNQSYEIADLAVGPGKYLLIGIGRRECYERLGLPEMNIYVGETAYAWLTNQGDSVAIRDAKGEVIDEVVYGVESPWPDLRGSTDSLQLIVPAGADPKVANDHAENWVASNATNADYFKGHGRGTPGEGIKQAATQPVAKAGGKGGPARKPPKRGSVKRG